MRILHGLVAAAVTVSAAVTPAAPALAQATPSQGANAELFEFCYDLIESGEFPGLNLGECMSFNLAPEAGFKAHLCDFLRETGGLEEAGLTYSECVRTVE